MARNYNALEFRGVAGFTDGVVAQFGVNAACQHHPAGSPRWYRLFRIDARRDASRKAINAMVDQMGMSWSSTVFTKLTFRFMLLKRAYTRSEFEKFVSETEFHHAGIQESGTGFEIRLQKEV